MSAYIVTRFQEELRTVVGTFPTLEAASMATVIDAGTKKTEAAESGFFPSFKVNIFGGLDDSELTIRDSKGGYLTSYGWGIVKVG